jgi:hypothetical protein
MRRSLFAVAALTLCGTTNVWAQDVEGFRLGMSVEEVQRLASERSYTMNLTPSVSNPHWKSYFLFPDGPYVAFCRDRLSSTGKTIDANLHAFANTALKYNESFGEPTTKITHDYGQMGRLSTLNLNWILPNGVEISLTFMQVETSASRMSYSMSLANTPCRRT